MRKAMRLLWVFVPLLITMPAVSPPLAEDREVYDSLYNHLIVERSGSRIFFRRMENGSTISAIDMSNPAYQLLPYSRFLFAAAFAVPEPQRALTIGLGAGAFDRLFVKMFDAHLMSVEIDEMIYDVAVDLTGFETGPQNDVAIEDGRVFLRRNDEEWDWIVIDAFVKNSQIPPHLTTVEFYDLVKRRLAPGGVLAINLHAGTRLFDSIVATLKQSFPSTMFFDVPDHDNVIALASAEQNLGERLEMPRFLSAKLNTFGVSLPQVAQNLVPDDHPLIKGDGEVLSDDFAPVEFLQLIISN